MGPAPRSPVDGRRGCRTRRSFGACWRPRRVPGDRPGPRRPRSSRGAWTRLGRDPRLRRRPWSRPVGRDPAHRDRGAQRRPAVPVALGARRRTAGGAGAVVRVQGRRRDRRTRGQHACAAHRDPRGHPVAPCRRRCRCRCDRAGPHPLGQRRCDLRTERPSPQQRGTRGHRRTVPLRDRGAQRRCRQPRRPPGAPRPAHPRSHHDRCQGHPLAGQSSDRRRRRRRRGLPAIGERVRGVGGHRCRLGR